MTTREEAIRDFAKVIVAARLRRDSLPARQAAEEAWTPGGPPVDVIEARIKASRRASASAA